MCKYIINSGNKIEGTLKLRGAKNAVLPIMAATILNESISIIHNVPNIADVLVMIKILESIGCKVEYNDGTLVIDSSNINSFNIDEEYVKKMRSSIILMGAMISRFDRAKISQPGGCAIGARPIDLHLKALKCLGVKINEENNTIYCFRDVLNGSEIVFDKISVGATENAILAAVKAKGITKIYNAAKEPEIEDLQNFLNAMGAKISSDNNGYIEIEGVEKLNKVEYSVIPDRIAIGTYMISSVITGGKLEVEEIIRPHMEPICNILKLCGCEIEYSKNGLYILSPKKIKAIDIIKTEPHPGFPTDMQSQLMALMAVAGGESKFFETIFENRFMHCNELIKMGANIDIISNKICKVNGVDKLYGAKVRATDLRGGASLIIASLVAQGETEISDIYHIERGYEDIENVLRNLGADIKKE